ncbi:yippee zinc-binding/DNA-binding /Mis18- centromere assembly-domain-containing protein [Apiospora kogelbergensis]|uniref:yippee zinc-binding/DNA-binding /Mis18- centromere assembly-domain-containing protein n=1 Tax=Apiospora kogelbergensis TaxID=1337665 RepID=UPI00312E9ACB
MADGTPIPAGPPPRYASYLLPSFSLPFKRRQFAHRVYTLELGRKLLGRRGASAVAAWELEAPESLPGHDQVLDVLDGPGLRLADRSHDVADITCNICHAKLGWKYVDAKEDAQKYKVGKYILETNRTVDFKHWDDDTTSLGVPEFPATATTQKPKKTMDAEPIVFDSEDEDECDDIFSGTWDPAVVAKRRAHKAPRPSRRGL